MIPGSGFVAPPPPNGLGPPRRRERSSRLVCVEASQHALHVYIHTHRLYIHTYILTDKYIHTPIHACTYRHAPPTHRGGRGEDHLSPLHTKTCAPRPFGGGWGVGPAALDHIYIYSRHTLSRRYTKDICMPASSSNISQPHPWTHASCTSSSVTSVNPPAPL